MVEEWDVALHARDGARFVTRDEFQEGKEKYLPRVGLVNP